MKITAITEIKANNLKIWKILSNLNEYESWTGIYSFYNSKEFILSQHVKIGMQLNFRNKIKLNGKIEKIIPQQFLKIHFEKGFKLFLSGSISFQMKSIQPNVVAFVQEIHISSPFLFLLWDLFYKDVFHTACNKFNADLKRCCEM